MKYLLTILMLFAVTCQGQIMPSEMQWLQQAASLPRASGVVPQQAYSLNFDGTNDYVGINSITTNSFWNGAITISVWAKLTSFTADRAILSGGNANAIIVPFLGFVTAEQKWKASTHEGVGNNFVLSTATQTGNTNWTHFAWLLSSVGKITAFYVNATNQGSDTSDTINLTTASSFRLGGHDWHSLSWAGKIDELNVFNRQLSALEVTNLYNNSSGLYGVTSNPIYTNGLLGILHFDEGTGVVSTDSSGNNNNGTNINGVTYSTDSKVAIP